VTLGLNCQQRTRLHCFPVHEDGARAAVRRIAADVRAGQPEMFANIVHQKQTRFHVCSVLDSVDGKRNVHPPIVWGCPAGESGLE